MWLAVEVETLARQYHGCLQIGTPPLLSKAEIENVRARMAGYGVGGDEVSRDSLRSQSAPRDEVRGFHRLRSFNLNPSPEENLRRINRLAMVFKFSP